MDNFLTQCQPPWRVFPKLNPDELSAYLTQGETEAYFDHAWRPFWAGLTPEQKAQYLDHWNASPSWRDTIRFHFDTDFD